MENRRRYRQAGMTLIEIMIVLAIIALIGGVVGVNVFNSLEQANVDTARTQIKAFESALANFRRDNGYYPSTEQGLQALIEKPSIGKVPQTYPKGGYLQGGVPKDPWKNDFKYYAPGLNGHDYEILSLGKDGVEGGEDLDADIKSYEK